MVLVVANAATLKFSIEIGKVSHFGAIPRGWALKVGNRTRRKKTGTLELRSCRSILWVLVSFTLHNYAKKRDSDALPEI